MGPSVPRRTGVGALRGEARLALAAEQGQILDTGADERDSCRGAGVGQLRVLGQESVARVHSVAGAVPRGPDDRVDVQIRGHALASEQDGFVRNAGVQRFGVVLSVHRNAADAEIGRGSGDADGNLTAVGDEQALDGHWDSSRRSVKPGFYRAPCFLRGSSRDLIPRCPGAVA